MALKRFVIDGYGQVELNNVAFRRDGRIEAQCALDETDFASIPAENGMLLAVDKANGVVKFAKDGELPIALNYSSEHMYSKSANGLKDFRLMREEFYPRMGYPTLADLWTSNCLCYDDGEFADDEALTKALEACKETPVYGGASEIGAVKLSATKPTYGPVLKVVKFYTMPDGQPGVKLQVIA